MRHFGSAELRNTSTIYHTTQPPSPHTCDAHVASFRAIGHTRTQKQRVLWQCRVEKHKYNRPYHPAPFPTHLWGMHARCACRVAQRTTSRAYTEECDILYSAIIHVTEWNESCHTRCDGVASRLVHTYATHCTTLQHTTARCDTPAATVSRRSQQHLYATHCNTLHPPATHCNTPAATEWRRGQRHL